MKRSKFRRLSEQDRGIIELDHLSSLQQSNPVILLDMIQPMHDRENCMRSKMAINDVLYDSLRILIDTVIGQYCLLIARYAI